MTSVTYLMEWLCAVLMVPLMLFIWALDTKKQELTDIEVMAGAGKRSALFITSVLLLLGDGVWHKKGTNAPF